MPYKIAILGAGDMGKAKAAYLASKGHQVNLFNRSLPGIEPFIKTKTITFTGSLNGEGKLHKLTTNIFEAIDGVQIILLTTPALYHKELACKIAPYLNNKQLVILFSGKFAGSNYIENVIKEINPAFAGKVIGATSVFSSRMKENGEMWIRGVKQKVRFASNEADKTVELTPIMRDLFESLVPSVSFLERSFCDIGCILHVPVFLSNFTRIEHSEDFYFYKDGVTPKVADLIAALDEERVSVAKAYNQDVPTLKTILNEYYNSEGINLYEVIHNTPTYMISKAPKTFYHRYIMEELLESMVPMYKMALLKGLDPVLMRSYIDFATKIYDFPFMQKGRDITLITNEKYVCS